MDDDHYYNIFHYCLFRARPEEMKGKVNKNKWKSFKKKCKKFYSLIFPLGVTEKTMKTGTMFRKCWSPKLKIYLQKIVMMKKDFAKIWKHFHLSEKTGGHRGIENCNLLYFLFY